MSFFQGIWKYDIFKMYSMALRTWFDFEKGEQYVSHKRVGPTDVSWSIFVEVILKFHGVGISESEKARPVTAVIYDSPELQMH